MTAESRQQEPSLAARLSWKALTDVVVGGRPVKAGESFPARVEAVQDAVGRGLVEAAKGRRRS